MERHEPVTVEQMYDESKTSYEETQAILEKSRSPRPASSLYETVAALGIGAEHTILDIGARDARHGLELASRLGCRVIGVEPVESNRRAGARLIADHTHGALVELRPGVIENIPVADGSVDLVFCRDVMSHVTDIDVALDECSRVLRRDGAMVMYQTFAAARLEPRELTELADGLAMVVDRMDAEAFERAATVAGFDVERCEIIGSQWREAWEEDGSRRTSQQLLHLARLLRVRDELVAELGELDYRIELANALWGVYQMIGKLEPRVYVVRKSG